MNINTNSEYKNLKPTSHTVDDPTDPKKVYRYLTHNLKEEYLFQAVQMACRDQCPPDIKDYLCKIDETEDTSDHQCAKCILRWATQNFKD